MTAVAVGERSDVEPESRVGWVSAVLDLAQVRSIQPLLPTQLL